MSDAPSRFGRFVLLKRLPSTGAIESHIVTAKPGSTERRLLQRVPLAALRDGTAVRALVAEAARRSQLAHPHLAGVLDAGTEGEFCYVVSEWVEGVSLKHLLRQLADLHMTLPPALAVRVVVAVARGLEHALAHSEARVVHRDLGPHAVLLDVDGAIKLKDLGSGLLEGAVPATSSGTVLRRFLYHAPEQTRDAPIDGRSNVFSLAVMLYEMLAGSNPFARETPVATLDALCHEPALPLAATRQSLAVLDPVVRRALAKRPEDRFAHAGELAAALEPLLAANRLDGFQLELGPFVGHILAGDAARDSDWMVDFTRTGAVTGDVTLTLATGEVPTRVETPAAAPAPPAPDSSLWPLVYVGIWLLTLTLTFAVGRELLGPSRARATPRAALPPRAEAPPLPSPTPLPSPVPSLSPAPSPPPATALPSAPPETSAPATPSAAVPAAAPTTETATALKPLAAARAAEREGAAGTLQVATTPEVPVTVNAKRLRHSVLLKKPVGRVVVGAAAHGFEIQLRYHIANGEILFDLDSEPWALVFERSGPAVGRTPLRELPLSRAQSLRVVFPQKNREVNLRLDWTP
jgi:serine/threonine protein kinase